MPTAIVLQPARNGPTWRHWRTPSIESGIAGGAAIENVAAKSATVAAMAGFKRNDIEAPWRRAKSEQYSAKRRIVGSRKYEAAHRGSPATEAAGVASYRPTHREWGSGMSMLRIALLVWVLVPLTAGAHSFGEPRVRGGIAAPPVAYGNFVYAPSGISFEIWDLSDATHPAKIPYELTERTPGPIFALAIVGADLYAAWSNGAETSAGFEIYSLADPAHPVRVGEA